VVGREHLLHGVLGAAGTGGRGCRLDAVDEVTTWQWIAIAVGALVLIYGLFVGALVIVGRHSEARALARFIPDCVVLFRRLIRDRRVAGWRKVLLVLLVGYLLMPFDLVPDFIPVAGILDDAILVVLVLRVVLRGAGPQLLREHWPGPEESLRAVLRAAYPLEAGRRAHGGG
jgi:uncharacterized membrane protein YkvA (DUF1232 family)